jgi:hypothetical protein
LLDASCPALLERHKRQLFRLIVEAPSVKGSCSHWDKKAHPAFLGQIQRERAASLSVGIAERCGGIKGDNPTGMVADDFVHHLGRRLTWQERQCTTPRSVSSGHQSSREPSSQRRISIDVVDKDEVLNCWVDASNDWWEERRGEDLGMTGNEVTVASPQQGTQPLQSK